MTNRKLSSENLLSTGAFAQKWGLELDEFGRILEHNRPPTQDHSYMSVALPEADNSNPHSIEPSALYIRRLGRFSNALIQIAQAIEIALRVGARVIYLPPDHRTFDLFESRVDMLIEDTDIRLRVERPPSTIVRLEGEFFYSHRHSSLFPTPPQRARWIRALREHTGLMMRNRSPWGHDELVIHIRAGDIFSSKPHGSYAQPPLSFYNEAIRHFKPRVVHLVYENNLNPVIRPLKKSLVLEHIEVQEHSGALREDISVILNAQALVAGSGTFVPGILALSEHVKTVYTFEKALTSVRLPHIKNWIKHDELGLYKRLMLQNNWKNKGWQRWLMTAYPNRFLSRDWLEHKLDQADRAG